MVSLQSSLSIQFKQDKVVLTHLGKGLSRYTLVDCEVIDLSSLEDDSEEHVDALIQNGISHFLEEHRIKPDSVSIGIPREDVFFSFAQLPKLQGTGLDELLKYEIERHVPLPTQAIFYDAQVIGGENEQNGLLSVVIVAAPRERVMRYASIVEQIGLSASVVSISALGLVDFFSQFESPSDDATVALVDCDNGHAEVVILKGKALRYCRAIDLEREPSPPPRASSGPREEGDDGDGSGPFERPYSPTSFHDEISQKRAEAILYELASYVDMNGDNVYVDEAYLSGEYRSALALQGALLEQGFTGRVKLLQPHQRMRSLLPPEKANALCPAIGLGMRDFEEKIKGTNLLPPESRPRKKLYGKRFMIGLAAAICILLASVSISSILKQRMEIDYLEAKVAALDNEVKLVSSIRRQTGAWGKRLQELRSISANTLNPLLILKELDRLLPSEGEDRAWLTNFRLKGNNLSINGISDKPEQLLAKLEESPIFKNVLFEGRVTSRQDSERFGLVLDIDVDAQWKLLKPQGAIASHEEPLGPDLPPEGLLPVGPEEEAEEEYDIEDLPPFQNPLRPATGFGGFPDRSHTRSPVTGPLYRSIPSIPFEPEFEPPHAEETVEAPDDEDEHEAEDADDDVMVGDDSVESKEDEATEGEDESDEGTDEEEKSDNGEDQSPEEEVE